MTSDLFWLQWCSVCAPLISLWTFQGTFEPEFCLILQCWCLICWDIPPNNHLLHLVFVSLPDYLSSCSVLLAHSAPFKFLPWPYVCSLMFWADNGGDPGHYSWEASSVTWETSHLLTPVSIRIADKILDWKRRIFWEKISAKVSLEMGFVRVIQINSVPEEQV